MRLNNKRSSPNKIQLLTGCVIAILLLFSFSLQAQAEDTPAAAGMEEEILEEQAGSDEIKKIEGALQKHEGQDVNEILPGYDPQKIIQEATQGKFEFSMAGLLNRVLAYLLKEVYLNIHLLVKLIILIVLCALLKNLQTSFLSESVGELAFYTCYIVIVSILLVSFHTALSLGISIIDTLVGFMHATIPVLITLLVSGGNLTSAGIMQPILVMIVEITATIMKNFFLPLIFLSTILSVVDNMSEKVQISRLTSFLKQLSTWGMGTVLTVFIGFVSIQGSMGAVIDGVTTKTAKFAITTFIPVAGKILSDAAETVVGCTLVIKNAAGIGVMIGIIAICVIPILKIAALVILYRVTCILVEPIAEKRIVSCINEMAGSMTYILGLTAAVSFMFMLTVTLVIKASNVTVMIR
jgi:stage III sporulation protein AE